MTPDLLEAHFAPGRDLGCSQWVRLPQALLTQFEELTLSRDPLHTDPEWVRRHTHYPDTIAPGFLTLSLLPYLAAQVALAPEGHVGVNYGFDRLRWPAPVPVGTEVRAKFIAAGLQPRPDGQLSTVARVEVTVEMRGTERPAMVASWLVAMLPDSARGASSAAPVSS